MSALKYWDDIAGEWKYVTVPVVGRPVETFVELSTAVPFTPVDTEWNALVVVSLGAMSGDDVEVTFDCWSDTPIGASNIPGAYISYSTDGGVTWAGVTESIRYGGGDRQTGVRVQRTSLSTTVLLQNVVASDLRIQGNVREVIGTNGFPAFNAAKINGTIFRGGPVVLDNRYAKKNAGYQYADTIYFTSSGAFDKANYPDLRGVRVKLVGGGGGSGGTPATGTGEVSIARAGSGAGYAESFLEVGALLASESVVVGAGGSAGAVGGVGGTGGDSSFGAHISGFGGVGGPAGGTSSPDRVVADTVAGAGASGDLVIPGNWSTAGHASAVDRVFGCGGGDSKLGAGGRPRIVSTGFPGNAGTGFGSGAGGAASSSNQAALGGSPGRVGIVIVELYA